MTDAFLATRNHLDTALVDDVILGWSMPSRTLYPAAA